MLYDHRGIETARLLLHAAGVSEGYVALWERKRLDLTVEALILVAEWHPLFSEPEREISRKRLAEYGYKVEAARS
jgi:transcriptional regulator with XRE-family HTH domain